MGKRAACLVFAVAVLGVCVTSWGQQKASAPNPADGAMDVNPSMPLLRWTAGSTAALHNVYLGMTPELGPEQLVGPSYPNTTFYYTVGFQPATVYFWRVDEIDRDGVTIHTGDVWMFMTQALTAYHPSPADGANDAAPAPVLTWLPGQGATQHHVYFSDDQDAVSQAAAGADKGLLPRDETAFTPGDLQGATTYFWRVDEVTLGGLQAGPVWSFTTWVTIDDFESYNDEEGKGTRIYETWIDGLTNGTGSTVGYWDPPFAEQTIVHGGLQSMPLDYNNIIAPFYSEAERAFAPAEDWTANGVDTVTLHVRGRDLDFEIPRVSTPPVLDGQVDEAWLQASVQYIKATINGTAPTGLADASGLFRVLYDDESLYVLVDVNDATLVQDSDPAQGWLDDRVEVFIDGDNSKNTTQDGQNDYQYCFRWNHGVVETPVEWYRSPDSLTGVQYGVVTTDSGYRVEIKLPWTTMIGVRPQAGRLIGMDVVFDDDDDGGGMDSQLAWHLPTGDPHRPNLWGTARLAKAVPGAADRLYVALRDNANHTGVAVHPDPEVVKAQQWVEWKIPLNDFADTGVNLAAVQKMMIGIGDRDNPVAGDAGMVFVDDIYLTKPAPGGE